jgi:hypothetical protein
LTAKQIGIDAAIAADPIQNPGAHITIPLDDLEFELIEPIDEDVDAMIGARIRHRPTGITAEATSYENRSENQRAALQALALRLVDRETHLP